MVLVLTLTGAPHRVVGVRRALDLVRRGKAVTILEDEEPVRWVRGSVARPSVIYLTRSVPAPRAPRPTKRGVLQRDRRTCAYCGRPGSTVDHVYPQHLCRREGRVRNTWLNMVCACHDCQRRKGGQTMREAGMTFRPGYTPFVPRAIGSAVLGDHVSDLRPEWREFVPA